ncbi:MAG: CRISPR-associated protein Cas5 [Thermodesulfobacteriota bacterium]
MSGPISCFRRSRFSQENCSFPSPPPT